MIRKLVSSIIASFISVGVLFSALILISDAGWRVWSNYRPVTDWVDVSDIVVSDSYHRDCPRMAVSRTIHLSFNAVWSVEVEQKFDHRYTMMRKSTGANSYSPLNKLPDDLDIGWWSDGVFCEDGKINLTKGVYRMETTWVISADHYPPKTLTVYSNDFIVH